MGNNYLIQEVEHSIKKELGRIISSHTEEDERYSINLLEITQQLSPIIISLLTGFVSSVLATKYINVINQTKRDIGINLSRGDVVSILAHSIDAFQMAQNDVDEYKGVILNKNELIEAFEKQYDEYITKEGI